MIEMDTALVGLYRLLHHPDPGFICVAAGDLDGPRHLARVRHYAREESSRDELAWIFERLGEGAEPFALLYACHNGARLFAPAISRHRDGIMEDGGFEYFPIDDLRTKSRERVAGLLPADERHRDLLAFAQVPLSANLICIECEGKQRGNLVELNHDAPPGGFGLPEDLGTLLGIVTLDSAYYLRASGCYTRYSDGKSEKQWVPIRYVPDASAISAKEVAGEPIPEWLI